MPVVGRPPPKGKDPVRVRSRCLDLGPAGLQLALDHDLVGSSVLGPPPDPDVAVLRVGNERELEGAERGALRDVMLQEAAVRAPASDVIARRRVSAEVKT